MKFAQKISSSRRSIWKACSACSPPSASTWAASGASSALAGWIDSPPASSSVGPRERGGRGGGGEPLHVQAGDALAQRAGDCHVAPGVAEADRRGDEQRAPR